MAFKATKLIGETFDQRGVNYRINDVDQFSDVEAGFKITGGPVVYVRFISNDDTNDVGVRVFGLFNAIPDEKRTVMLEACNQVMNDARFLRFCLNKKNDVNLEYDFVQSVPDEAIGPCCYEILFKISAILDQQYPVLARALYAEPQENKTKDLSEALKILQEMQKNPITIEKEKQQNDTGLTEDKG